MAYPSEVDTSRSGELGHSLDFSLLQHYLNEVGVDNAEVFVQSSVTSTNDVIREYASHLRNVDLVGLAANEQTAGRGRLDRTWVSTFGLGIACSVAVSESQLAIPLSAVPLASGLAAYRALRRCGVEVGLKWPNDLVVTDDRNELRKLGGILVQRFEECLVIGIGINLLHTPEQLPIPQATSAALLGYRIEPELLIAYLVDELNLIVSLELNWLDDYHAHCVSIGSEVTVQRLNQESLTGFVVGIDESGHLLLRTEGEVITVESGDVHHLKRL